MKSLVFATAIVFFLGASVCHAQIEIEEKDLLGEWCLNVDGMFVKADAGVRNFEFMTGGKYRITPGKEGAAESEGTYTFSGAYLILKPLMPMIKIETLNDEEMIGIWFEEYRFTKGNCPDGTVGVQIATDAAVSDDCGVDSSWSGDLNGSYSWTPALDPSYEGFSISNNKFSLGIGWFNITARFDALPVRQPGTYQGTLTHLFAGVAQRYSFPSDTGAGLFNGVPVTLTISEWDFSRINGKIETGPLTGTARGSEAPRTGGPTSPRKTLTVTTRADFRASGNIGPMLGVSALCHVPRLLKN